MAAISWSATSAPCRIVQRAPGRRVAPQGGTLVGGSRHRKKFRLMSLFRTRLVAQSAAARFGTHHSRRLSCALSGGISTEPCVAWVIQYAMGHELCLYRSNAVRQGSVVLLLKISMVRMKKLIALLSHSEAFAVLLLEVAECSGQLPSKPARLLQACRNKHCSARHKRVHAASFDALWRLRCPKIDRRLQRANRSFFLDRMRL